MHGKILISIVCAHNYNCYYNSSTSRTLQAMCN